MMRKEAKKIYSLFLKAFESSNYVEVNEIKKLYISDQKTLDWEKVWPYVQKIRITKQSFFRTNDFIGGRLKEIWVQTHRD